MPPVPPEQHFVRASDVRPYEWSVWCRIEGSEPFENEVVSVNPSKCGEYLWFMLDTHNFLKAKPDDMMQLVPKRK